MNQKKDIFTLERLRSIYNIVTWGTIIGGFILWICMPWDVPIYHTGNTYYEGSKLPLLIFVLLPFLSFLSRAPEIELHGDSPESKEIERQELKKWILTKIYIAVFLAIVVLPNLIGILIASR